MFFRIEILNQVPGLRSICDIKAAILASPNLSPSLIKSPSSLLSEKKPCLLCFVFNWSSSWAPHVTSTLFFHFVKSVLHALFPVMYTRFFLFLNSSEPFLDLPAGFWSRSTHTYIFTHFIKKCCYSRWKQTETGTRMLLTGLKIQLFPWHSL